MFCLLFLLLFISYSLFPVLFLVNIIPKKESFCRNVRKLQIFDHKTIKCAHKNTDSARQNFISKVGSINPYPMALH